MTSIDMQTLRTRKWHLNITKHLMERHFAEPGGQLGTGGNSNTVGPLGIPCQRDLKNRSMATCDTCLWSPLLKGTICPDFFPVAWPKKGWLLKKVLRLAFFDPSSEKKSVIKKVETDIRWDIFLIIYAFPLQKQQGRQSHSFFLVCLLKIPGAEWNHLGLGLCQNLNRCDANRWFGSVHPLRAVSKAAPAFAKAGGHCATRCRCCRECHWGCSWCEILTDEIIRSSQPLMVLLEEGSCSPMKWLPRAQNTSAHFDSRVGTIEAT